MAFNKSMFRIKFGISNAKPKVRLKFGKYQQVGNRKTNRSRRSYSDCARVSSREFLPKIINPNTHTIRLHRLPRTGNIAAHHCTRATFVPHGELTLGELRGEGTAAVGNS
ncbi:hypothetical protein EVAR_43833_1 [Eumeta japonica]|uniref:Uncharacterized protein n=1 Tax=Eumeta variegata TaxID=151549 RepID=A0A4C1WYY8_EUMVA|nr:hypothetical protein EVAR_43833_1 [Eumeta japonica]